MGVVAWAKHLLTIYVCLCLIGVWLFQAEFTNRLGVLVIIILLSSLVFLLQMIGVLPSHKN
ncbi:hypothetical protein JXA12_01580 [Candidatus Woesearchaeota archaeon]|nr:hypothetical protein [Candidatus Woesearchaeota archaeon]